MRHCASRWMAQRNLRLLPMKYSERASAERKQTLLYHDANASQLKLGPRLWHLGLLLGTHLFSLEEPGRDCDQSQIGLIKACAARLQHGLCFVAAHMLHPVIQRRASRRVSAADTGSSFVSRSKCRWQCQCPCPTRVRCTSPVTSHHRQVARWVAANVTAHRSRREASGRLLRRPETWHQDF